MLSPLKREKKMITSRDFYYFAENEVPFEIVILSKIIF